ncbi:MAG: 4-alpha-glucanotransferase [Puniceicoccales bacterium]|jgi:4-alpha-glucanotransferase|nr:4-alpha-glucanotransferase [Puniceicoccales bacterium]
MGIRDKNRGAKNPLTCLVNTHRRGVILSPLSLGGQGHWGDIGHCSRQWLRTLHDAGIAFWRIPERPEEPLLTQQINAISRDFWVSAFAGNPLYVDLLELHELGLLTVDEVNFFHSSKGKNWEEYAAVKSYGLHLAARNFPHRATQELMMEFLAFVKAESEWLEPYVLFRSLLNALGRCPWNEWPEALKWRDHRAMDNAKQQLRSEMQIEQLWQFFFYHQWRLLLHLAKDLNLCLIGPMSVWLEEHEADVWLESKYFFLDDRGIPTISAIPKSQQEWPLHFRKIYPVYRWNRMGEEHYGWWSRRIQHYARWFDGLYISDFGDLIRYAEISVPTAGNEVRYASGPGVAFFQVLQYRTRAKLCIADISTEEMMSRPEGSSLSSVFSTLLREQPLKVPVQGEAVEEKWRENGSSPPKQVYLSSCSLQKFPDARNKKEQMLRRITFPKKEFQRALRFGRAYFSRCWRRWCRKRLLGIPLYLWFKQDSH